MPYSSFIVLDLETTGVDPATGDIIEFAAIKLDHTGKVIGELDMLVGTDQEINTFVRALTGIKQGDVAGKPKIAELMPQIVEFIGDAPIVGHNIAFDVDFLNGKGANLENDLLDTLELAQTVLPKQAGYSLEYLTYHFAFPHKSSHRAMDDVMATADLFYLLISSVKNLPGDLRKDIVSSLSEASWSWLWLFSESENFSVPDFKQVELPGTDQLVAGFKTATDKYIDKIASNDHLTFVETHFAVDPLSLALSYAAAHKPAILCLSTNNLRIADWPALREKLNLNILPLDTAELSYREDAEKELIKNLPSLSGLETRLIIKTMIWKTLWRVTPDQLFLTTDERYQWEQKLSVGIDRLETLIAKSQPDIIVVPPQGLLALNNISGYHLVVTDPLSLEDAAFHNAGRTLSVPYFNALVSSRRDFVHLSIRENDPKAADHLFKILNDIGGHLTELTSQLIAIFAAFPPTSPFDRNLELVSGHMTETTRANLTSLVRDLQAYVDGLTALNLPDAKKQIDHTARLVIHLRSLLNLDPEYRYFLWADGHRFFLELVPRTPSFSNLSELLSQATDVRVLGSGLTYTGSFDYWQTAFPGATGMILPGDLSTELNVLTDLADDDQYSHDLQKTAESLIADTPKSLVLTGTSFDSNQLFESLYEEASAQGIAIDSQDTLKAVENLPHHYDSHDRATIIGYFWWFERARFCVEAPAQILLGKVPFEASSRPQSKVMQGDFNGFESYTLPRTVMKFKDVLHLLALTGKPLTLADSRLYRKDYGRKIINSCIGINFIPS